MGRLWIWVCMFGVLACAPKSVEPQLLAPKGTSTEVMVIYRPMNLGALEDGPDKVKAVTSKTLAAYQMGPRMVDAEPLLEGISQRRTTRQRVLYLAEQSGQDGEWTLLMETSARFYSELSGRYRWVVEVAVGLGPPTNGERVHIETFDIPVFLDFQHQQGRDAVDSASPLIGRKLERIIEVFEADLSER